MDPPPGFQAEGEHAGKVCDDASGIAQAKLHLQKSFDVKDLGPLRYFLGIETMLDVRQIDVLPLASVLSMVIISYHGRVRSRLLFLNPLLKLNTELWLKVLVSSFGFNQFWESWGLVQKGSSRLFYDNKSAIMLASDSVLHERSKHIEVDIHFIREKVRSGIINPIFVPSSE
ncbi:uncharacterized protein LOC132281383 [Cornus florida]|uniref:uncharacterized protein LOC132281383 n=1 Tax=Cornus florida TaxID=4283 RepID=UPI0028980101|nr:uncharacterized protein LOC132281383 [Cornus florida]